MNRMRAILTVLVVHLGAVKDAAACAVCFGEPNSAMVKGAEAGILVLLGVIGSLLLSIIGVTVFWAYRAKRLSEMQNAVPFPAPGRS